MHMEILNVILTYVIPFLVVLTILVFVHELGHYLIARRCGVRVFLPPTLILLQT